MNDEHYTPVLASWLRDSDVPPPDPQTSAHRIMAQLPEFEEPRGRWPFHRRAAPVNPATIPTAEYQHMPFPATNGHTPTVIGRTQTMFSPAKAVAAAALVFGIGGVLLIAQPFQNGVGTTPGAGMDANTLVLEDGTGDFHVVAEYRGSGLGAVEPPRPTDGPAAADLVDVIVAVDSERLTVRFDSVEPVLEVSDVDPGPSYQGIAYLLLIDTDGDPDPEYQLWSQHTDGSFSALMYPEDEPDELPVPGEIVMADGAVTASVRLDALPVRPTEMRFAALTNVFDRQDPQDMIDVTISADRVPDDEAGWRALGDPDGGGANDAIASPGS